MMRALILALALVGCSYPEEDFLDDFDAASCDWQADCYDYQDHAECMAVAQESRTAIPDACTYDPKAARECVRDYESISCPNGAEHAAAVPAACGEVWSCD